MLTSGIVLHSRRLVRERDRLLESGGEGRDLLVTALPLFEQVVIANDDNVLVSRHAVRLVDGLHSHRGQRTEGHATRARGQRELGSVCRLTLT